MSQKNVEIVRRLFKQWSQGDFSNREPFAEDLDFEIEAAIVPDPVRTCGIDGMATAWREILGAWDSWRAGPIEELIEVGDRIVVFSRIGGRGAQSGAVADAPRAAVFTFRGGKIARLFLTDRNQALEAVGLRE
jgi:ketosteroid isomerase-like protein